MIINKLKTGSKIAIAAPARMVTREEMALGIQWLKDMGFVPVYDDRLFNQYYIFSGDDDTRAAVFQKYLDNEDIDAIWIARGGYGSIRISQNFYNIRNGSLASAMVRCCMEN